MANKIDPYSYGVGYEHGRESNWKQVSSFAHGLALIEDKTRDVLAGKANMDELLYLIRDVCDV